MSQVLVTVPEPGQLVDVRQRRYVVVDISTPTLIDYRTYLQQRVLFKPNSVNRALVSLKRYFAWLVSTGQLAYDPARVIKLVGEEVTPPASS